MCLIAFAYNMHPVFELVVIANRDEFYARPTRTAGYWNEEGHPKLLAGKDLESGGTWMGINKSGHWGALTNYRDPSWKREDPPTRGNIVLDYLKQPQSPKPYLDTIKPTANAYMGFNILAGSPDGIFHYSNYSDEITHIEPGIHGVSNALLDTPWPKLDAAKNALSEKVKSDDLEPDSLFKILGNTQVADDRELPKTGIPYKWEKAVSSIFINTGDYGTRCSTLLFIKKTGEMTFIERRYKTGTQEIQGEQSFVV